MLQTIQYLIRLSRIGMLPLSLSVPILGAVSLRQPLSWVDLLALAGIGISAHFFGFIINDLIDFELDKHSPYRQASPLVTGHVTRQQAWLFVAVQVPIALGLYWIVLDGEMIGTVFLTCSVGLSLVYNLFSKWRWLPRILAELALALSVTLLGISGAWAVQPVLPPGTVLYCATLGLVLLLVNSVPSGLKDIRYDSRFNARSFVLSIGARVSEDGALTLSNPLKCYMISLQVVITILAVALGVHYALSWLGWIIMGLLLSFSGLHTSRLSTLRHIDEFPDVFLFLGGFYNYLAFVILVWTYLPPLIQFMVSMVMLILLSLPFRRAWSLYRRRHKRIIDSS